MTRLLTKKRSDTRTNPKKCLLLAMKMQDTRTNPKKCQLLAMKMKDTRTNPKKLPVVGYKNKGYKIFIILMWLLVTVRKDAKRLVKN